MSHLAAGAPIEPPARPIGRRSTLITDPGRDDRELGIDVWYPAVPGDAAPSEYELLPGVTFTAAAALHEPDVARGRFPLILFSHGRTGTRLAYSLLCEALAARGAIVVSADHPGDALADWLLGTNVDDRANEINRVGDANLVLDLLLRRGAESEALPLDLLAAVDHDRIAMVGHSYGAYTALATAAGARGVDPHDRVRAVVGLQPYTRSMSDGALARIPVPVLLVVSEFDTTTPSESDGDRPWALLTGSPVWRVDLFGAAHRAPIDMGLYAELADDVPDLPDLVRQYLAAAVDAAAGGTLRPWRELLAEQIRVISAFLDITLDIDRARGEAAARMVADLPGLTLQRR